MSVALQAAVPASRLEALKGRHAVIDAQLSEEQLHRSSSDVQLRQLKKLKLRIKEQIEGLS